MTRAYLALTEDALRAALAAGEVPAGEEVVLAESDAEQDEYAALMSAADLSADLVAATSAPGRRVVAVAEVADAAAAEAAIAVRLLAAVHLDDEPHDWAAVDADRDLDLGWYTPDEVGSMF